MNDFFRFCVGSITIGHTVGLDWSVRMEGDEQRRE